VCLQITLASAEEMGETCNMHSRNKNWLKIYIWKPQGNIPHSRSGDPITKWLCEK
jgi:hypothetical protein